MKPAARIKAFIADHLLDGQAGKDPLAEGLVDSLGIEQLIAFLEETFDIRLEDDEVTAEEFSSISRVVALVERKQRVT